MFYEVFIPSNGTDGFDVTITVEADNWMTALKSGLERTGQGADSIRNVMCDIKEDNTIHVTDATTARVFVLREVEPDSGPNTEPEDLEEEESSAKDTLLDIAGTLTAQGQAEADVTADMVTPEPEEDEYDDVAGFETQRMSPVDLPPLAKSPAPTLSSRSEPVYESREPTQPRHRPPPGGPPPAAAAPPPEARPNDRNNFASRTTPQSGVHAPPPGAAPPPAVRHSGSSPAAAPEVATATTQPLTPTGPPPSARPPAAAAPSARMEQPPVPAHAPPPQHAPPPTRQQVEAAAPPPEPEPLDVYDGDDLSDPLADLPDIPDEEGLVERSWTSDDGRMRIGSATFEALKREAEDSEAKVVRETRAPSGQREAIPIGRADESVSQNALEEVFLEINQIHEGEMSMEQVINYVMDLSMSKIRAEAGSIMFADVNGRELYFATARGPKAHEVMDFRVPMTKGLAGFCAREGVSLAISEAEKDPRFYKEISIKIGYETKNICCAPIQFEGRVYGAIELMNKTQPFTNTEVNVLTYIGRQLARFVNDLIMAREKI